MANSSGIVAGEPNPPVCHYSLARDTKQLMVHQMRFHGSQLWFKHSKKLQQLEKTYLCNASVFCFVFSLSFILVRETEGKEMKEFQKEAVLL